MGPRLTHATWGRAAKSEARLQQAAAPRGSLQRRQPGGPRGPAPAAPHTFFGLGVGDLQIAAGRLQLLAAHDLGLEVAQGDVEAVEGDHVIGQFGKELVVDSRHGWGQAVPVL